MHLTPLHSDAQNPEQAQAIAAALDLLLIDIHAYQQEVRTLQWTPSLRLFPSLYGILSPLVHATEMGSQRIASRIMDLGVLPTVPHAQLTQGQVDTTRIDTFEAATRKVIHESQQLLLSIKDTFAVAADYHDQPTMEMLSQAAQYLHNTIWAFSTVRSMRLN